MKDKQLAEKWIKELKEAGYTYDEMLKIFRMAREKYEQLKAKNSESFRTRNLKL